MKTLVGIGLCYDPTSTHHHWKKVWLLESGISGQEHILEEKGTRSMNHFPSQEKETALEYGNLDNYRKYQKGKEEKIQNGSGGVGGSYTHFLLGPN